MRHANRYRDTATDAEQGDNKAYKVEGFEVNTILKKRA